MSIRWCGTCGALGGAGLGGADVHAAIDQGRIDADDLQPDLACSVSARPAPARVLPLAVGPARQMPQRRHRASAVPLHQRPGHQRGGQRPEPTAQRQRAAPCRPVATPSQAPIAKAVAGQHEAGQRRGRARMAAERARPPPAWPQGWWMPWPKANSALRQQQRPRARCTPASASAAIDSAAGQREHRAAPARRRPCPWRSIQRRHDEGAGDVAARAPAHRQAVAAVATGPARRCRRRTSRPGS